ncbi:MAG: beta-propeller fold lactonase family protein [Burkholderiales bacterium]|nr:beta-propeller fold lactonase family protein [Burkholderiales bacterium]
MSTLLLMLSAPAPAQPPATAGGTRTVVTVPGMPPVPDPSNLYSETAAAKLSPAVAGDLRRIYVPHIQSNDVYVIDPTTYQVVGKFKVGLNPQHVVPSWDLRTLWVANNAENTTRGSLTPVDPQTGKPGPPISVDDPYNMYFTPDGKSAIIVAEALKRLDFRDPKTMQLQYSIDVPKCAGINHADFSIDGRYAIFTCEFSGTVAKVDLVDRRVLGYTQMIQPGRPTKVVKGSDGRDELICTTWKGMPQDIRASPDGRLFYVADMMADGVHVVDGESLRQVGFIETGKGTHGLYPSRDGSKLYVANRGSNKIHGAPKGKGSVSVIDFATGKVVANWPIPGGGSPDMGNVSADGRVLWLSGRYDNVVYAFDTTTGEVRSIPVGKEPHGLTVWPQPGRYSLGHTGNLR